MKTVHEIVSDLCGGNNLFSLSVNGKIIRSGRFMDAFEGYERMVVKNYFVVEFPFAFEVFMEI